MNDPHTVLTPPNPSRLRRQLFELLGDLPDREAPFRSTLVRTVEHADFIQEDWLFEWNQIEPVPGVLLKPRHVEPPFPAVLYHHAHGGDYELGKDELLQGRKALRRPYGPELVRLGYAVLCVDAWCFGERQGRSESEVFKEMLWKGEVLWGRMVFDALKAFDFLTSRPDIKADSVASMGISMGGTMALWSTALEPRIRACVDLCSLADYDALIAQKALDRHGIYYYVPDLLKHTSASELNSLTAPRPRMCVVGRHDALTPISGVEGIDRTLSDLYSASENPEGWNLLVTETGHFETELSHTRVLEFLQNSLS
jgi:dienelactone hydrolase